MLLIFKSSQFGLFWIQLFIISSKKKFIIPSYQIKLDIINLNQIILAMPNKAFNLVQKSKHFGIEAIHPFPHGQLIRSLFMT